MKSTPLSLIQARSFLFVPAMRPERIEKALASGADVVVVDLEDAIAATEKSTAQKTLALWLETYPEKMIVVRINGAGTPWHETDLVLCRRQNVIGVMLPKTETSEAITYVRKMSGKPVMPIIETADGLGNLNKIATAPGTCRLVFGKLDLAVALGLVHDERDQTEQIFLPYRAMLVLASCRAGLPAPVDGVFTLINNITALAHYVHRVRCHGFGALLLIHPNQVEPVHSRLTPSEAEIAWAQTVQTAAQKANGGVVVVEGQMVDAPVIAHAERILSLTRFLTGKKENVT